MAGNGAILDTAPVSQEIFLARKKFGDYTADPASYYEVFNLLGMGIYQFLGVNINGAMYLLNSRFISYNKDNGELKIRGLKTLDTDKIAILFNRIDPNANEVHTVMAPVTMNEADVVSFGDFNIDPDTYSEVHDLSGFSIYNFVGLSVDSAMYLHPAHVSFEPLKRRLTVTGLKLRGTDQVCLMYNTKQ